MGRRQLGVGLESGRGSQDAVGQEGVLLDPTYSGKTFAVLLAMLRRGDFAADEHVVFLHTGGTVSVFAYPELVENQ